VVLFAFLMFGDFGAGTRSIMGVALDGAVRLDRALSQYAGPGFDHCLRLLLELRFWVLVREMIVLWATVAVMVASLRGLQPT